MNTPIKDEEIIKSLRKVKFDKAPGPDHTVGEMLRYAECILGPYLNRLFNSMFNKGVFPFSWTKSIIVPVYKKGNANNPDNYRGISLISVFCKVFTCIINERLQNWANDHELICEEQAGSRRGYSTTENIFILHDVIEQYLSRKRKLFVAFIDFQKAFDTFSRYYLWKVLSENCTGGKMLTMLQAIYSSVASCVRHSDGCTAYFECSIGLKQGCNLSPQIFSYLINEIGKELVKCGKYGVQIMPDPKELFILLFADDVVLLSDTVHGLQNQLGVLERKSGEVGLTVNMDKSKIIVFRLGGHLASHERWCHGDKKLEVVNEYRYLGIIFSTKLCTNATMRDLASRAKAAVMQIIRSLRKLNTMSFDIYIKLFDSQVQPILLYASEVWVLESCNVESVHLFGTRLFLDVSKQTPSALIDGETGRFPSSVTATLRAVKYWLRVLHVPCSRYPPRVLEMMRSKGDIQNKWCVTLKSVLSKYGFEHVWATQEVVKVNSFLITLRQKLIEQQIYIVSSHQIKQTH